MRDQWIKQIILNIHLRIIVKINISNQIINILSIQRNHLDKKKNLIKHLLILLII
jgi:hypothetical protein